MNGPLKRDPESGLIALICGVIIIVLLAIGYAGDPEGCSGVVCEDVR